MKTTTIAMLTLLFSACADEAPTPGSLPEPARPDAGIDAMADALQCGAGTTACGSSCVDLMNDSDDCGQCGHSCRGSSCANGLCEPTVLAQGQAWPVDIAVTPTDVYWVNQGGATGSVMRLEKSRLRFAPTTLVDGQSQPVSLALDQTSVYWLDSGDSGSLQQTPLLGGAVTTLESNLPGPAHVAEVAGHLFWTHRGDSATPGSVMKRSISGGPPVALVTDVSADWIAVDRKTVYYSASDDHVHFVPILGGPVEDIAAPDSGTIRGLALSPSHVYWATFRGLMRATIGGSAVETLYSGPVLALTVDTDSVYFVEIQSPPGASLTFNIRKLSLDGSSTLQLAADQAEPRALAMDDAFVYWVNYKGGTVVRVAK